MTTVLNTLHVLCFLFSKHLFEVQIIIMYTSMLPVRKLKPSEIKQFAQGKLLYSK